MSVVGAFPGMNIRRRVIRAPVNPMDKSTIVSIYPKEIDEVKHTIQPGRFIIQPGTYQNPSILVVGPSSWWREIDEEQPLLEIPNSSIQVADSIVRDYSNGLLACNMADAMPGLFYIPGEFTLTDIKLKYANLLAEAKVRQDNWYQALIRLADGLWARTNGNPLCIAEDMRLAARELSLDKDWMKDFKNIGMIRCIACGNLRNPEYPICASCHNVVDRDLAKKLGLDHITSPNG